MFELKKKLSDITWEHGKSFYLVTFHIANRSRIYSGSHCGLVGSRVSGHRPTTSFQKLLGRLRYVLCKSYHVHKSPMACRIPLKLNGLVIHMVRNLTLVQRAGLLGSLV
jgi:hypothetical protein